MRGIRDHCSLPSSCGAGMTQSVSIPAITGKALFIGAEMCYRVRSYCHDINHMNAGRLIQTSGYTWAGTNWRTFLLKNVTRSFFGLICEVRTSLSRKTSVEKPLVARAQIVCSSADLIVSPIQASALYAGMRIDTSGFVYLACASKYD